MATRQRNTNRPVTVTHTDVRVAATRHKQRPGDGVGQRGGAGAGAGGGRGASQSSAESPAAAAPVGTAEARARRLRRADTERPSWGPGPRSGRRPANLSTWLAISRRGAPPRGSVTASTGPQQGPREHPQSRRAAATRLGPACRSHRHAANSENHVRLVTLQSLADSV